MHKKIVKFTDEVCSCVRYKGVHQDIKEEMEDHIQSLKDEYMKEYNDEEKALDMAIAAMGNAEEIGMKLDKEHKPQTEWSLIGLVAVIAAIGGIVMFIASKSSNSGVSFSKYLVYSAIGICTLVGMMFFDYTKLKRLSIPLYVLATFLTLCIFVFGVQVLGKFQINVGPITIKQDYIIILYLLSIVGFLENNRGKGLKGLVKICILMSVHILSLIMLPDLGLVLIMSLCYGILIVAAIAKNHFGGNKRKQIVFISVCIAAALILAGWNIVGSDFRLVRLQMFYSHGETDPNGSGYIYATAHNWLQDAGLFGKTVNADGAIVFDNMPYITTDFVLVNIITTMGWIAAFVLIIAAALLMTKMFLNTGRIKSPFGYYLSLGASALLSLKFVVGILFNLGLFIPLSTSIPFVSYGGFEYVANMALFGLVLSIWRRNNLITVPNRNAELNNGIS